MGISPRVVAFIRIPAIITGEMEAWPALGVVSPARWWGDMG
jgi:hypothetical protein